MIAKPAAGRPDFERIALLLQGGGALGSYQAGVYQALAEADLHPDCVAGISIGAINSAIIAGNPPGERVDKLRRFWETVSSPPLGIPDLGALELSNDFQHQMVNQWRAFGILMWGAPSFFQPRIPPPIFTPAAPPDRLGFYDTKPLKSAAREPGRFRPHQRQRDALQRRRGQHQDRQLHLLREPDPQDRAPSTSWRAARCRPASPPSRSTASTIGTAASSPTRRCNGCSTAGRARTRSPSRSICGARAASCRAT